MAVGKCKNCGGDAGLHHYQTDQCPVGGRESTGDRPQEWKTSTFDAEVPFDPPNRLARDITVREHFAALAMQGLCADPDTVEMTFKQVAHSAIRYADALIEALNNE